MIQVVTAFFLLISVAFCSGQEVTYNSKDVRITHLIDGTLLVPSTPEKSSLAIIIQGSGPTDRDGNQTMMMNNSLKYLAQGLYENGIASFRYDKRIVAMIRQGGFSERNVRFDDFVDDAIAVIAYFEKQGQFDQIYIIGHSQGSLVGMIASQQHANGFISLAGAGQEIDAVLVDQLAKQVPGLTDNAREAFNAIRTDGVAQNYSPALASIFRPDIQPFMRSWMLYSPQEEILKLDIPILIVNGAKDLQIPVSEAELLKTVVPNAQYEVIENMNHVLKDIQGDDLENGKAYNEPAIPVSPALIEIIAAFIHQ